MSSTTPVSSELVVLRGEASGISRRLLAGGKHGTHVVDEVSFRIEDTEMTVRTAHNFLDLDEGDDFIAAGYNRRSGYELIAWWNVSRRRGYLPRAWDYWLWIIVAGGSGLALLWILVSSAGPLSLRSISGPFGGAVFGSLMARSSHLQRKAAHAIKEAKIRGKRSKTGA